MNYLVWLHMLHYIWCDYTSWDSIFYVWSKCVYNANLPHHLCVHSDERAYDVIRTSCGKRTSTDRVDNVPVRGVFDTLHVNKVILSYLNSHECFLNNDWSLRWLMLMIYILISIKEINVVVFYRFQGGLYIRTAESFFEFSIFGVQREDASACRRYLWWFFDLYLQMNYIKPAIIFVHSVMSKFTLWILSRSCDHAYAWQVLLCCDWHGHILSFWTVI